MEDDKKIVEKEVNVDKQPKQKRSFEISPEAKEERRLLAAFLLDKKEELIEERNKRKKRLEEEKIVLRKGTEISRIQISQFVASLKQSDYAKFPNDNPFFTNMFRLHPELHDHNPKKFEKPFLAGKLLKWLTYDRFHVEYSIEILGALAVFAMPDGIRLHNCHEFLTPKGAEYFIGFRDQANEMMDKFEDYDWYKFSKEYAEKYKLPFQPRLF